MPWKKNDNGEDVYIPSIYSKNDLPTWEELYRWYKTMEKHWWGFTEAARLTDKIPYWDIPERLYLCAVCCNQLNKMRHEDGLCSNQEFMDSLNELLKDNTLMEDGFRIINMSFSIFYPEQNDIESVMNTIYTLSYKRDPFTNQEKQNILFNVTGVTANIGLTPILHIQTENEVKLVPVASSETTGKIATFMLKDVIEYFEGNKVGWKDIISDKSTQRCPSGFDPSL